jgi:hypothetical protein
MNNSKTIVRNKKVFGSIARVCASTALPAIIVASIVFSGAPSWAQATATPAVPSKWEGWKCAELFAEIERRRNLSTEQLQAEGAKPFDSVQMGACMSAAFARGSMNPPSPPAPQNIQPTPVPQYRQLQSLPPPPSSNPESNGSYG